MSITGAADDAGGEPTKVGVAIADVVTGLHGAVAILAALRGVNGPGRRPRVEASGSTSPSSSRTLSVLVNQAQNAFATGVAPARRGNAHPNIAPYESFATADGQIAVAAGSERQWSRLCARHRVGRAGGRSPVRDQWPAGRRITRRCGRSSPSGSSASRPPSGSTASRQPRSRAGRSTTSWRRSGRSRPVLGRWSSTSTTPSGPVRQVGLPFKLDGDPRLDPERAAPPRRAHRRDPCRARLRHAAIARLRAAGVV